MSEKVVEQIIEALGGRKNICDVSNCMTRLRIVVRDESMVDEVCLKGLNAVLGVVHNRSCAYEVVVGPGKARKYADVCFRLGFGKSNSNSKCNAGNAGGKKNIKAFLKIIGDIFIPLIPGIITAGLCASFASLISEVVPDFADRKYLHLLHTLLSLVNSSFLVYISAWVGYRAAEKFGATPILGGMIGMITSLDGINTVSKILGLFNEALPLDSILRSGKGGVIAVIAGVWILSLIEKRIRKVMPENVDIIFTPILSIIICVVPYILIIMPAFGYLSSGIAFVFGKLCMSSSLIVRILVGYVSTAFFLPLVAAGMHHGLVAIYSVQLQEIGYVTLYPALAMAGAGQVGAALAILIKARKVKNNRLCSVINGGLPAGLLGVGEPLIYGVTLPLGKPFIYAGLGAGIGGAFVMAMQVASTTWGPSGLIGVFVMTAGPNGALKSALIYFIGLVISYIASFIIKYFGVPEDILVAKSDSNDVKNVNDVNKDTVALNERTSENRTSEKQIDECKSVCENKNIKYMKHIKHGEPIFTCESVYEVIDEFKYVIKDSVGLHARPCGEIVRIAKSSECDVTVHANGKTASAKSLVELMNLGVVKGTEIVVKANGNSSPKVMNDLKNYIEKCL